MLWPSGGRRVLQNGEAYHAASPRARIDILELHVADTLQRLLSRVSFDGHGSLLAESKQYINYV